MNAEKLLDTLIGLKKCSIRGEKRCKQKPFCHAATMLLTIRRNRYSDAAGLCNSKSASSLNSDRPSTVYTFDPAAAIRASCAQLAKALYQYSQSRDPEIWSASRSIS